jgi:hypothetical protein
MMSSRFHAPPRIVVELKVDTVIGGPPVTSTFFTAPSTTNPRNRLSGDQNGVVAPSVPGSRRMSTESMSRIQIATFSVSSTSVNASVRPSGEIDPPLNPNDDAVTPNDLKRPDTAADTQRHGLGVDILCGRNYTRCPVPCLIASGSRIRKL